MGHTYCYHFYELLHFGSTDLLNFKCLRKNNTFFFCTNLNTLVTHNIAEKSVTAREIRPTATHPCPW